MVDIARLSKVCSIGKYSVDEIVFNQGDPGHTMYILLAGSAEVLINAADGEPVPINTLKAGDFFGEMSILEGEPRSATVRIVENAIALVIDEKTFPDVMSNDPTLSTNIMKGLSGRLRRQNKQISKLQSVIRGLEKELSSKDTNSDAPIDLLHQPIDGKNGKMEKPAGLKEPGEPKESGKSAKSEKSRESGVPGENEESRQSGQSEQDEQSFQSSDPAIERAEFESIMPKKHKTYAISVLPVHETFLFSKNVVCPVCGKTFEEKMVRSSKLRVTKVEKDFRRRYENFEPLWYNIWACPHCYYANFSFAFEQVTEQEKKAIIKGISTIQQQINWTVEQRSINEVFSRYYLALNYVRTIIPDVDKLGKLWLRIAWLYDDVGDAKMAQIAAGETLIALKEQFFKSGKRTTPDQDQYLALMLGELSLRLGDRGEAAGYFRQAVVNRGGNKIMNDQARDRINELSRR